MDHTFILSDLKCFFFLFFFVFFFSNQDNHSFVIKLMKYKTLKICNCKDYTANSCISETVSLNGH